MTLQRRKNTYRLTPVPEGILQHLPARRQGTPNEQIVCSMEEAIEPDTLKSAWRRITDRHEVLRASIHEPDSEAPSLCVNREVSFPWKVKDLGTVRERQETELNRWLAEDRENRFEFDRAPLFRLNLFRLANEKWTLAWTFQRGILDARSIAVVLTEVYRTYDALRLGEEAELAAVRPYSDYLEFLKSLNSFQAEQYWRDALNGFRKTTSLKMLEGSSNEEGQGEEKIQLSTTVSQALAELANRERFTVQNAVEAAWGLLLSRYNGSPDVVFGAQRPCRGFLPRAGSMVGTFANTLPVRVRIPKTGSIFELLRQMRSSQLAMRDFEHTSPSQIWSWSELPAANPLFESVLVSNPALLDSQMKSAGLDWAHRQVQWTEHTNFPLALFAYAEPALSLRVVYDRKRFGRTQIQQALANLKILLEDVANGVDQSAVKLQTKINQDQRPAVATQTKAAPAPAPAPAPTRQTAQHCVEKPAPAQIRPLPAVSPREAKKCAGMKAGVPALARIKPAIAPPIEAFVDQPFVVPILVTGVKPAAQSLKSSPMHELPAAIDPQLLSSPDSFLFKVDFDADQNRSLELFAWATELDDKATGASGAALEKNRLALRCFLRELLDGARHAAATAAAGIRSCSAKSSALCELFKSAKDRIPRPHRIQEVPMEAGLSLRETAPTAPAGTALLFTPSKRQPLLFDAARPVETELPAQARTELAAEVKRTIQLPVASVREQSSLVPIQPKGNKPAIFCIGELDDELKAFRAFSAELGIDQPVWGLDSSCLEDDPDILGNVKKIASQYIDQLRAAGQDHPYCLAGYSFGGLVALEMAQQLRKSGVEVPALVLIDTYYERGRTVNEKLQEQIHRCKHGLQKVLGRSIGQSASSAYGSANAPVRTVPALNPAEALQAAAEISKLQQRAADRYRARRYPGRACIFTVSNPLATFDGAERNGWDRIFNDSLSIYYEIPGDRGRINTSKHAALIARRFREFFGGVEEFSSAPVYSRIAS